MTCVNAVSSSPVFAARESSVSGADGEERVVRRGHVDHGERARRELPPVEHAVEGLDGTHLERGLDDGDVEAVARGDRVGAVGVGLVAHDAHVLGARLDHPRAEHRGGDVLGQAERRELVGVERDARGRRRRGDVVVGDRLEVALDEAGGAVDRLVQRTECGEERADDDHGEHGPADDRRGRHATPLHA